MAPPSLMQTLSEYMGFDAEAAQRLEALGPRVRPFHQRIVDQFYQSILLDPGTRAVLKSPRQIDRLKEALLRWLEGLFQGPYDDTYFQRRARIGRMHVKVGLEQRYMLAAMNVIRVGLHRALAETADEGFGHVEDHGVIDQICDMELAIMLETYREDYVLRKTAESESLAIMGRLTAGMAHEVRNPLNAAKLQLDVLRRNAATIENESLRRKIERRTDLVQGELRRLSLLLDDFLNLARARTLDPVDCEALALVTEVVELRRPEIESQGIELIAEVEGSCQLFAERDRIKQVVNNLITNAVEAVAGRRGPTIRIVSTTLGQDRWEVAVIDNGPGISVELAERAFESFVTTKEAGTGLGLAIVKRIVDLHGGAAVLAALPEGGTRASFWIPTRA